jgi:F-type H+-transporting ATPase subunit epsilon
LSQIQVNIVSAEGLIYSGPVMMLFVPASTGEMGIAPRHAPLLTKLAPGEVRAQQPDGSILSFYVSGGILEIQPNLVSVLADSALRAHELDEAAAKEARDAAREALKGASQSIDLVKAEASLIEAEARYKAAQKFKGK